ncbi:MAG: DegT/DnrJ/EryC1/StrS aminotransferase [Candidatus Angelobacter sp.]|nr:DegT/DnrJ/EryC1/StrS aminotransferase [Candidatus Angelobacter sp.]
MLDLSRQYASIREEVLAAVARACDSQRYILGDEVVAFEREFAALCGTADSVGCLRYRWALAGSCRCRRWARRLCDHHALQFLCHRQFDPACGRQASFC